ncbi:MAG: hypothetical protein NT019_01445 [Candidatus Adlerbacteria bacterium]|nr:hypothetical protein [Candidatus Adlerbacteria bacterium]
MKIKRLPLYKYELTKLVLYWSLLPLSFWAFSMMVQYCPQAVLAVTSVVKPVLAWLSHYFLDLLWNLTVPEPVRQQVNQLGGFLAPLAKPLAKGIAWGSQKVAEVMDDRAKAALSLAFGGFILISLLPRLLRLAVMPWVYARLVKDILSNTSQEELLAELERRKS